MEVFKMLTTSSSKCLSYDEVCAHFGEEEVEEMILRSNYIYISSLILPAILYPSLMSYV